MDLKAKAATKPVVRTRTVKKIVDAPMPDVAAVEPVAQGDGGDPAPIGVAEKISALPFMNDEHGRYVAPKGSKELFIYVGGARYEHVSETADGRWVYAAS